MVHAPFLQNPFRAAQLGTAIIQFYEQPGGVRCRSARQWVTAGLRAPFPAGKCPVLVGRGDQAVGKHLLAASPLRASHPRGSRQIGWQSAVIQFGHTGN